MAIVHVRIRDGTFVTVDTLMLRAGARAEMLAIGIRTYIARMVVTASYDDDGTARRAEQLPLSRQIAVAKAKEYLCKKEESAPVSMDIETAVRLGREAAEDGDGTVGAAHDAAVVYGIHHWPADCRLAFLAAYAAAQPGVLCYDYC